jgi:hypothetical protein
LIEVDFRAFASVICIQKLFLYMKCTKYIPIGSESSEDVVQIFGLKNIWKDVLCKSIFSSKKYCRMSKN